MGFLDLILFALAGTSATFGGEQRIDMMSPNPESESKTFKDIFIDSFEIARTLKLTEKDVDGIKWNTSIPKLIDNAIIGFFKHVDKHGEKQTISSIKELEHQT